LELKPFHKAIEHSNLDIGCLYSHSLYCHAIKKLASASGYCPTSKSAAHLSHLDSIVHPNGLRVGGSNSFALVQFPQLGLLNLEVEHLVELGVSAAGPTFNFPNRCNRFVIQISCVLRKLRTAWEHTDHFRLGPQRFWLLLGQAFADPCVGPGFQGLARSISIFNRI